MDMDTVIVSRRVQVYKHAAARFKHGSMFQNGGEPSKQLLLS